MRQSLSKSEDIAQIPSWQQGADLVPPSSATSALSSDITNHP